MISIETFTSVNNPNSVHGLFPYRGKISGIDAQNIILQLSTLKSGGVLLDPFCGTGTILYEGFNKGMSVIGIDNNPLAVWIARGKLALSDIAAEDIRSELENIINKASHTKVNKVSNKAILLKAYHPDTLIEILSFTPYFDKMSDYLKAAFLGTTALVARGCNNYLWTSNSVGKDIHPKRYISFIDKFKAKVKKHFHLLENNGKQKYEIYLSDSRDMTSLIEDKSIDCVFTSPPYFDALDYTSYYGRIAYELLEVDVSKIRSGLIQRLSDYKESMEKVLRDLNRIVKDDGIIIFVVGDKKVKNQIINGGEYFSEIFHHKPSKIIEREYTKSTSQLFDSINKTKRKEQIVIWDKSKWD